MLLRNVHIMGDDSRKDILVSKDKIAGIFEWAPDSKDQAPINFNGALIFPGLINSHDHLDFNFFSRLGHRLYANYREWGNDIQVKDKSIIGQVLKIPKALRIQWGMYKNLLNGVTTVVNHGEALKIEDSLIQVFQETHSYHSVGFEKNWKWKINRPKKTKWPLVIHNGEGTDGIASAEIDELIKWNIFKKEIIAVHGTMMDSQQAEKFKALVWCPDSNHFLLGKTADIASLKNRTKIIFGTDSTLTASWNIWEQLRMARDEKALTDQQLFDSLTSTPAEVWGLKNTGKIKEGYQADIVIAKAECFNDFYQLNPADLLLVMSHGNILMLDEMFMAALDIAGIDNNQFSKIQMDKSCKYVAGDLPGLVKATRKYYKNALFPFNVEAHIPTEVL